MLVLFVDYKMPALSFLRTYPYTNASLTGSPGHTLIIQNAGAAEAGPGHTLEFHNAGGITHLLSVVEASCG